MPDRRHKQVVNIDEVTPREEARGGFRFRGRRLGPEAGSRSLGCTHFELAPGMTAFPFHFHTNYEEALYVLEGAGTLRIGDSEVNLRAGDYVAFPAGPESAHALTNTGTVSLRYLALSGPATPVSLDICVYPDSNKVAYAAGVDPAKGLRGGAWIMGMHKQQPRVDYYLDEPIAKPDG
jgi:uncharacterized cupin superfamily protein